MTGTATMVEVGLLRGPFKHLNNRWEFFPIRRERGSSSSSTSPSSRRLLDGVLHANFDRAVSKLMGCFEAGRRGSTVRGVSFDFDATVVGAGAVGLACGRALAKRGPVGAGAGEGAAHRPRRVLAQFRGHPRRSLLSDRFAEGAAVRSGPARPVSDSLRATRSTSANAASWSWRPRRPRSRASRRSSNRASPTRSRGWII
jgi:hypothetical protein